MEIIIFLWLGILTVLIIFSASLIIKLFSIKGRGLKQVIYEVLEGNNKTNKQLIELKETLNKHLKDSQKHLYKSAIVRFNPFERLGGEQSYSIAVLNEKNSGLVMTFLYTKEGVRAYVKEVVLGKGREVELSKEEKQAILLANQQKN